MIVPVNHHTDSSIPAQMNHHVHLPQPDWFIFTFLLIGLSFFAFLFAKQDLLILVGFGAALLFFRVSRFVAFLLDCLGFGDMAQTLAGFLSLAVFGAICVRLATYGAAGAGGTRAGGAGATRRTNLDAYLTERVRRCVGLGMEDSELMVREGLIQGVRTMNSEQSSTVHTSPGRSAAPGASRSPGGGLGVVMEVDDRV